jgi:hypothetical protein
VGIGYDGMWVVPCAAVGCALLLLRVLPAGVAHVANSCLATNSPGLCAGPPAAGMCAVVQHEGCQGFSEGLQAHMVMMRIHEALCIPGAWPAAAPARRTPLAHLQPRQHAMGYTQLLLGTPPGTSSPPGCAP